jgi:hypothetical protein
MSTVSFPSGRWAGWYCYEPKDRHAMEIDVTFADGTVRGSGQDEVGTFTILGEYNAATDECGWVKTYSNSHAVYYSGYCDDRGIWGRWDIGLHGQGGFHIWPKEGK